MGFDEQIKPIFYPWNIFAESTPGIEVNFFDVFSYRFPREYWYHYVFQSQKVHPSSYYKQYLSYY